MADDGNRPVVELFVKAAVDKMKNGGCPMCHRYFMIFYILRERGLIDLIVTTFLPESPPKEVLDFSNGKRFPLVKVQKGVDGKGRDISGLECDTVDEIEALIERFNCDDMRSRKESAAEATAEKTFEDLYMKFCQFLKSQNNDPTSIIKVLEKIESHLASNDGEMYMTGNNMAKADCYLLPVLQHVRVAGKAYKNFEIPTEMHRIWNYLKHAYDSDAFQESCPADREIITQYNNKASCQPQVPLGKSTLMGEERTFSIPDQKMKAYDHDDY
ncbi:hypothetical protein HELRODRAFT_185628 [Helobdella robusta]|uniref:CLIC N-terminal domain-containing protein n=1 Tax=Helobdella robusta TaxID=6412 RepID=T1FN23_HELRO|nr:hypothetical protein HELRODRAFT_185628 [Helobdella robusta]ESO03698.1 hypothetical protein HELRODRAFT_185628 [Helobdella robusta]